MVHDSAARPHGFSSKPLGLHRVGATAHLAKLPKEQLAEIMHRRSHMGVDKMRAELVFKTFSILYTLSIL